MADAPRCLVFGGSGALGRTVCETLAADGARLVLTYRARATVAREVAGRLPDAHVVPLELGSIASVEAAVDAAARHLGGIDAFVQCAGTAITKEGAERRAHPTLAEIDEPAWDAMLDVNARSTFFAIRRVSAVMRGHGGGNLVIVGSIDGVKPVPSPVHYAASKGALAGMMAALAKELGRDNIRVNMVAPGIMEDGISRVLDDGLMKEYLKHCGLRRLGRLSEVAAVVAWLARHNTYVTGRTVLVDGAL